MFVFMCLFMCLLVSVCVYVSVFICVCLCGAQTHSLQRVLSQGQFLLTVQSQVLDLVGSLQQQLHPETQQEVRPWGDMDMDMDMMDMFPGHYGAFRHLSTAGLRAFSRSSISRISLPHSSSSSLGWRLGGSLRRPNSTHTWTQTDTCSTSQHASGGPPLSGKLSRTHPLSCASSRSHLQQLVEVLHAALLLLLGGNLRLLEMNVLVVKCLQEEEKQPLPVEL